MRIQIFAALALCGLASACATPPENIKPVAVRHDAYAGMTCAELNKQSADANSQLAFLTSVQAQESRDDAIGVFLIGVPTGSIGDTNRKHREELIAQRKGEAAAIDAQRGVKGCTH